MTGPATIESHKGKGVSVRFPGRRGGNKGNVNLFLETVRRLRAASATTPTCALQGDAAHAPSVPPPPATAAAPSPKTPVQAQPPAAWPSAPEGAVVRGGSAWRAAAAAPERGSSLTPSGFWWTGEPQCAAGAAQHL